MRWCRRRVVRLNFLFGRITVDHKYSNKILEVPDLPKSGQISRERSQGTLELPTPCSCCSIYMRTSGSAPEFVKTHGRTLIMALAVFTAPYICTSGSAPEFVKTHGRTLIMALASAGTARFSSVFGLTRDVRGPNLREQTSSFVQGILELIFSSGEVDETVLIDWFGSSFEVHGRNSVCEISVL
jgi:hypothetical protein